MFGSYPNPYPSPQEPQKGLGQKLAHEQLRTCFNWVIAEYTPAPFPKQPHNEMEQLLIIATRSAGASFRLEYCGSAGGTRSIPCPRPKAYKAYKAHGLVSIQNSQPGVQHAAAAAWSPKDLPKNFAGKSLKAETPLEKAPNSEVAGV